MILFVARLVAAAVLLKVLGSAPDVQYTLVHGYGCIVAVYTAFRARQQDASGWMWAFGIMALLFYPLMPINLPRFEWALIDLGGVVLMVTSLWDHRLQR